jgi:hypothetical protein
LSLEEIYKKCFFLPEITEWNNGEGILWTGETYQHYLTRKFPYEVMDKAYINEINNNILIN